MHVQKTTYDKFGVLFTWDDDEAAETCIHTRYCTLSSSSSYLSTPELFHANCTWSIFQLMTRVLLFYWKRFSKNNSIITQNVSMSSYFHWNLNAFKRCHRFLHSDNKRDFLPTKWAVTILNLCTVIVTGTSTSPVASGTTPRITYLSIFANIYLFIAWSSLHMPHLDLISDL